MGMGEGKASGGCLKGWLPCGHWDFCLLLGSPEELGWIVLWREGEAVVFIHRGRPSFVRFAVGSITFPPLPDYPEHGLSS